MRVLVRVIGRAAAAAAGLVAAAFAYVYFSTETMVYRRYPLEPVSLAPTHPPDIARGRHVADLVGCQGCHGTDLRGGVFNDFPELLIAYPANLTLALKRYSDDDFARLIRRGVKPNGQGVLVMPGGYRRLSDDDIVSLAAYLRTFPPGGAEAKPLRLTWMGRLALMHGDVQPEVTLLRKEGHRVPAFGRADVAAGRYLASIACAECHGPALQGYGAPLATPDLTVAAAYDLPAFRTFMRTGVAAGGRTLPLMSEVARQRFSHFTDEEIAQLHAYLVVRAEKVH
jgi:mono/diheme cytochrome c family protein